MIDIIKLIDETNIKTLESEISLRIKFKKKLTTSFLLESIDNQIFILKQRVSILNGTF